MRISAFAITLLSAVSTLSGQVHAIEYLYRGDSRGPTVLKGENPAGFKAWGYDRPDGTLEGHITKKLQYPLRDPFISTSRDHKIAVEFSQRPHNPNPVGWVYYLDPNKIEEEKHDAAAYWTQKGKKNPYQREQEIAIHHYIPWSAVVKVERVEDFKARAWKVPGLGSEAGPSKIDTKKPDSHAPETRPQSPAPGDKPASVSVNPAPVTNNGSKLPIPVPKTGETPDNDSVVKPAPGTKPGPATNASSKIPVLVPKPARKPGKKGDKRHARDFSHDDETGANINADEEIL
ncbi:ADP-ribosylation [Dissoconium aciculare CBS 342.82]|uniref:ADP-ribosylation n=1 Tax=Dissoconium aciculare CBS 342.82 TaxID=1314786 RepID=A0A6J3MJ69_9PEZI|nr:ADP-ribosylation [Dissoconium aciculare CBS 342.82]KAF1827953.1 ADP-ribosylation [Dissoconium aciculare CBS 342.82]